MSSKITFESSEDEVLRGIISEGIGKSAIVEADGDIGQPVQVFKKIGGLVNLGRTYFWCRDEIGKK